MCEYCEDARQDVLVLSWRFLATGNPTQSSMIRFAVRHQSGIKGSTDMKEAWKWR